MKDKQLNDITRLYDRFIRQCPGTEEYTQRLAEETQIILQLRFVDYFIQIWDITSTCRFAKRHLTKRKQFYKEANYPFSVEKLDWTK